MSFTYKYPRPALTVDALVLSQAAGDYKILLIERGNEPFIGMWALPGGFVNMDETLETACLRELHEETGLAITEMKQFRVYDAIDRDPRHRTISVIFFALLDKIAPVTGADDTANAQWFSVEKLPALAFDHSEIVTDFLKYLANTQIT